MLTIGTWNASGLPSKAAETHALLLSAHIDVLFVTETWSSPAALYDRLFASPAFLSPSPSRAANTGHYPYGVAFLLHPSHPPSDIHILWTRPGLAMVVEFRGVRIAGAYLPPSWSDYQCLALLLEDLEGPFWSFAGPKALLGDLNVRLGELTADSATTRPSLYAALLAKGMLLQRKPELPPTYEHPASGNSRLQRKTSTPITSLLIRRWLATPLLSR